MADEFKDDEYHFSDESGGAVFDEDEASTVKTSAVTESQLKRNVLIGIGVVLALLFAYKFLGSFFSTKKGTQDNQSQVDKQQQVPSPAITITKAPTQTVEETKRFQPIVQTVTKTVTDPSVSRRLGQLQISLRNTQSNIVGVSNNVDDLKVALLALTNKIATLNQNVVMLTGEVQSQQTQLARLKRKPKRVVRRARKVAPRKKYFIQALIPGRAWLKSNTGSTITIREGSHIAGYGKVQVIDPHQGVIVTSSGVKITFSPSDT